MYLCNPYPFSSLLVNKKNVTGSCLFPSLPALCLSFTPESRPVRCLCSFGRDNTFIAAPIRAASRPVHLLAGNNTRLAVQWETRVLESLAEGRNRRLSIKVRRRCSLMPLKHYSVHALVRLDRDTDRQAQRFASKSYIAANRC